MFRFQILICLLAAATPRCSAQMSYVYTQPVDATNVTLGVKDSTGALIRTIFSGKAQKAGTYKGVWDGKTDADTAATGGPFTIALLFGNPHFTWDGTIGNTSNSYTGYDRWNWIYEYVIGAKLTFVNGTGWTTQGYSEGTFGLASFSDNNPNSPKVASTKYYNQDICFSDIANDGRNLYLISNSAWKGASSFVTKFDSQTGQPVFFTNGARFGAGVAAQANRGVSTYSQTTMSMIDVNMTTYADPPNAIAVQTTGNILAVAHGNWLTGGWGSLRTGNTIKFFDKTTGAALGKNATITSPLNMAFSSAGLWVVASGGLYLISSPGSLNMITQPIKGLSNPVSVDVNKSDNHIFILDGGTSQQLKEYDTVYRLVRTFGASGGYEDCNPTVKHNRLMVDNTAVTGTPFSTLYAQPMSSVRVESNGDAWIIDTFDNGANGRIQHVTPKGPTFDYISQVLYGSEMYMNGTSHTQPTRVYIGMNEYSFNPNVPNNAGDPAAPGGNGSWQFVRAWTVGAGTGACGNAGNPLNFFAQMSPPSITESEQLSNGHVYATVNFNKGKKQTAVVELPTSGTSALRIVSILSVFPLDHYAPPMAKDGSFFYVNTSGSGPSSVANINHVPLTGFDRSNNPIYGSSTLIASVTFNPTNQPKPDYQNWQGPSPLEPSAAGVYPVAQWHPFNSSITTNYPHLGGIIAGKKSYLFTALPEVCSTEPLTSGAYPCGTGTGNLGTGAYAEGHWIVTAYGSQESMYTPQFWLHYEDGMYVGWFGPQSTNSITATGPVAANKEFDPFPDWRGVRRRLPGIGQNMGTAHLVSINGDLFLHITSESNLTPSQIWRISNLSSVHEVSGTGNLGSTVTLSTRVF